MGKDRLLLGIHVKEDIGFPLLFGSPIDICVQASDVYNKIVILSPKIQDAKRLRLANIQEERMVTGAIKNRPGRRVWHW